MGLCATLHGPSVVCPQEQSPRVGACVLPYIEAWIVERGGLSEADELDEPSDVRRAADALVETFV